MESGRCCWTDIAGAAAARGDDDIAQRGVPLLPPASNEWEWLRGRGRVVGGGGGGRKTEDA